MMTPDERYQLQELRDALHATETTLDRVLGLTRQQIRHIDMMLDLGPNPYLSQSSEVQVQQMKAAARGPVCTCDFGWQPPCPRHAHRHDHQDERPPARPDGSIRHWPVCPQDHPAGEWCPTTPPDIIEAHDRFLRGEVITGTIGPQPPSERPAEPPTPRDLFGKQERS